MNIKILMIVNAIIAIVFGIAFVAVPAQLLSLYGISADDPTKFIGQLFGAALIGFAILTWTARSAADSDARKAIVLALFVADVIGFIIALIAQLENVVNQLGWLTVVIYLILALWWGYFQFSKPAVPSEPKA
jgi:hypothetical protein